MTAGSTGAAIADVTIDACVVQNSNIRPSLAADMQSLCALSSSIGALMGFSLSGIFVHLIGPKVDCCLSSLSIPPAISIHFDCCLSSLSIPPAISIHFFFLSFKKINQFAH
jgi:hypothetical protein